MKILHGICCENSGCVIIITMSYVLHIKVMYLHVFQNDVLKTFIQYNRGKTQEIIGKTQERNEKSRYPPSDDILVLHILSPSSSSSQAGGGSREAHRTCRGPEAGSRQQLGGSREQERTQRTQALEGEEHSDHY